MYGAPVLLGLRKDLDHDFWSVLSQNEGLCVGAPWAVQSASLEPFLVLQSQLNTSTGQAPTQIKLWHVEVDDTDGLTSLH